MPCPRRLVTGRLRPSRYASALPLPNALACLFAGSLLLGCGSHSHGSESSSPNTNADDEADDDQASEHDAGKTRDSGTPSTSGNTTTPDERADAGHVVISDTGSRPTHETSMPALVLEMVDECGSDNEAGLSDDDVQRLKGGGSSDGMAYLYPYDGTVFPRGLKAPLVMWQGGAGKAVYLSIRAQYFQYDGCLTPSADGQLQLKQEIWDKIGLHTLGPNTPYTFELSTLDGDTVHGPIHQEVVIAQATLKGSLYYNSYNSPLAAGDEGLGGLGIGFGAILRIRPGQDAEYFLRQDTCTGCHTVSANGQRLIAEESGLDETGQVYELDPDTKPNPSPKTTATNAQFVGLSPDGSLYINSSVRGFVGPNRGGGGALLGDADSALTETDTGKVVDGSGLPVTAMMPTFSPDGSLIAFNDFAQGNGSGLAIMDYDADARKASNERALYMSASMTAYIGWPFALPDNHGVIFTEGESSDFSGGGVGIVLGPPGPRSDLKIADIKSGKATLLARAMGFATPDDAANDKTYLPFGAEELHQAYYPTVSPVASGGYFWVFFDSVRHYGNLGLQRQLWGTAVTVKADGDYTADPSHPAFYLSGQELNTANHRAFTALDPCRDDGSTCATGIDCCSGFCTDGVCGPPQQCANTDEACQTSDDCCNPDDQCISGFCGTVQLL